MQNVAKLLLSGILICGLVNHTSYSAHAQQINKHPDGTIEVIDDGSTPAGTAEYVPPKASSRVSAGSTSRKQTTYRKIPAYTKRMGGVLVKRHADGSVEIVDETMKSAPVWHKNTRAPRTTHGNGQVITRHADGSITVTDTAISPAPSARKPTQKAASKHSRSATASAKRTGSR